MSCSEIASFIVGNINIFFLLTVAMIYKLFGMRILYGNPQEKNGEKTSEPYTKIAQFKNYYPLLLMGP